MANTTNFNWETPDDTDLVKDGAAAIRTLGSAIDTSLVDLKGGTTGQVLSKATNTDMDFTWVAQDDSNAIQNAIVDAKGDLISATAADTPARLAVGANNTVLTADSSTATGLKWATPAGGDWILIASPTTFSAVSSQSLNSVFTSTYLNYKVLITITSANTGVGLRLRFRASGTDDTTSNYRGATCRYRSGSASLAAYVQDLNNDSVYIGENGFTTTTKGAFLEYTFNSPQASENTYINGNCSNMDDGLFTFGMHNTTTSFDGFTIIVSGGNNITGNVAVYGLAK